jgi:signal transduction histidine kinase
MNILSSLRSRIFLSTALLAVLAIGIAMLLVSVRVTREAENGMQRELLATGAVVEQLRTTQAQTFTTMARLIADAPRLKAAVDTNDPPTVQDVVTGYETELNSNLLLVTNRSGDVLATVGLSPDTARSAAAESAVRDALAGRERFSLLPESNGILQLVTVPIAVGLTEPDILGTLSVGFLFDEALAQRLKQITGSEIAFGLDGRVVSTTLPSADRQMLHEMLLQADGPPTVTLHTGEYDALPISLSAIGGSVDGHRPVAMILRSRAEQLALLRTIRTELALTGAAAVLLATILSFGVARTITRPLAAITDGMKEVAATGDLTRKIVLRADRRWGDADARLLAATFNTLTESIGRFQREFSQRERLSSLGRLSTVIAHEVRNPLMIIKTALHTLRHGTPGDPAVDEAINDIDGEVARLNRVVNDVLDFARPIRFELAAADLNAVCRDSAEAAQARPGVPVDLELDPAAPAIVTDSERLRIALVNLIENARQAVDGSWAPATSGTRTAPGIATASEPPGIAAAVAAPPAVQLLTRAAGDHVTIRITDHGAGIRDSDLARVFDPYFTTRRGGTGLGLPIAKNIIEGLGGTIAVSTTPGRGTAISIDLPAATTTHY